MIYLPTEISDVECVVLKDDLFYVLPKDFSTSELFSSSVYNPRLDYIKQIRTFSASDNIFSSYDCMDSGLFTTSYFYRNDFDSICISLLTILLIILIPLIFIFKCFFRGFLK